MQRKRLEVYADRVMALAAKGCQFKEAMETLWPEEFEPEGITFEIGEFYTRAEGKFAGDIYTPMRRPLEDCWDLYNLSSKGKWGVDLGNGKFPEKKLLGFRKVTGRIVLER